MAKFEEVLAPGLTIRESANDGSDFTNPTADYRRLFLGEDGVLHLKDSAGTVTDIGGSSGIAATIVDAAGDLIVGTAADTVARLAIGTANGMILQRASGAVAWGYAPFIGAKAYSTAAQTIATATATAVTLNSEATEGYDTHAFHDTGSNTSRFTIPSGLTGYYSLKAKVTFVSNATGDRTIWFHKNGSVIRGSTVNLEPESGSSLVQMVTTVDVYLAATDYVEFIVYQTSGGNLDIGHASQADWQSTMSIAFLGA